METQLRTSPLAYAALVYAAVAAGILILLPHLETPLRAFGAAHAGALFLGHSPLRALLLGAGLGAALAGCGELITRRSAWGRRLVQVLKQYVGGLHPADALLLAALSSLAEELMFRGLLLPYTGVALSSILFGAAHFVPREGLWPWSVWATGAGALFAWSALLTGGLLAPLSAHFAVNAIGLLLLSRETP